MSKRNRYIQPSNRIQRLKAAATMAWQVIGGAVILLVMWVYIVLWWAVMEVPHG